MAYYGSFYRSALTPLLGRINAYLLRWSRNKYRKLKFFAHWAWVNTVPAVW
jgi:RNA-directed DNA polymerase